MMRQVPNGCLMEIYVPLVEIKLIKHWNPFLIQVQSVAFLSCFVALGIPPCSNSVLIDVNCTSKTLWPCVINVLTILVAMCHKSQCLFVCVLYCFTVASNGSVITQPHAFVLYLSWIERTKCPPLSLSFSLSLSVSACVCVHVCVYVCVGV